MDLHQKRCLVIKFLDVKKIKLEFHRVVHAARA